MRLPFPRPTRRAAGRRAPSTELALVALGVVGTVVVALILAWQAYAAYRANGETVARAAAHYASVASWEFARGARQELQLAADVTIAAPLEDALRAGAAGARGRRMPVDPPSLASVASFAKRPRRCDCAGPLPILTLVRLDFRGAPDVVDGPLRTADEPRRLRALVRDALRDPTGNLAEGLMACDLMVYAPPDGSPPRAVSVVVLKDATQQPVVAYVAESPLASVRAALARVGQRYDLLPPALLPREAQASAVAVGVRAAGTLVYAQGHASPTPLQAIDSIGSAGAPLLVRAALTPDGASRMLVGGAPRGHLPLIAALVLLALLLLGVALWQLARGAELERMRGDFVASVSHELRTPLALVTVYAETLLGEHATPEPEHEGFLQVILRESRRLARLVDNVLRFSEVERDALRLHLEATPLAPLVRAAVDDFEPLAGARASRVELRVEGEATAVIDPAALRQMMFNILSNAIKYGPDGQCVTVTLRAEDGRACLTIDDEGPGIPPSQRQRVFERYVRLADVERDAIAGGGIGLAVVRELARAQGIDVRLDDAPGGGTRVTLAIPATQPEHAGVPA